LGSLKTCPLIERLGKKTLFSPPKEDNKETSSVLVLSLEEEKNMISLLMWV
jgi:hypothetical protein